MYMYCTVYVLIWVAVLKITAALRRGMEKIILRLCCAIHQAQVALLAAFSSSALLVALIFILTLPH